MKHNLLLTFIMCFVLSCKEKVEIPHKSKIVTKIETVRIQVDIDELNLSNYLTEVHRILLGKDSSISQKIIDSLYIIENEGANESFEESVVYSPDSTFKIYTIFHESCGAYCGGNEWYSWIHYNLKGKEKVEKIDLNKIESIHKVNENNYLVIEMFGIRETGVLSAIYGRTLLMTFSDNQLKMDCHMRLDNINQDCSFLCFRQTSIIQTDTLPYIQYDSLTKIINYGYGVNDGYPEPSENDSFFFGKYKFKNSKFIKTKEIVVVRKTE